MIPLIKAEFRKIFSLRSTYVIFGLSFLMLMLFAFYGDGIKAGASIADPNKLTTEIKNALSALSLIGGIVAILLVTHEYRYNTIAYTLTTSKSRTKVLLAKTLVMTIFTLGFTLIVGALSPLLAYLGILASGHDLVAQNMPGWDIIWQGLFFGWGYTILALIIAFIIRHQIGAMVAYFMIPSTIESLLAFTVLKENSEYLPFTSLQRVMGISDGVSETIHYSLSPGSAAVVFLAWAVGGLVCAWFLFVKRDAN